ncbi:DUF1028 domain-containing protein [Promicromonospora sp. NPDC023987]|uniref:DUF1028 domain-containing protein n=1 Tax=Promicromonospora sp. NPDC023987 TaxID=3155360 RepID=UPI00340948B2
MTFSIVAHSPRETAWGVAVASRYLAVGAMVPAAGPDVGALATQAHTNMAHRERGLALLGAGETAERTLAALLADDPGRRRRQIGVVDRAGESAAWTGPECTGHAGHRSGAGYALQGNLLTGPEVLDAMQSAWTDSGDVPLRRRLLNALAAGDQAGGDRRGRQSAALLVVGAGRAIGEGTHVQVDLRVDDAHAPVTELARLLDLNDDLIGTA